MLRSPQDLYAKLLSSTHGYPLWTPKPSNEFLAADRPEGLRIGDVGIVTPEDGSFDALFNLCLPPNHRFHTRYGVPGSFTCIRPEDLEISTDFSAEPHGQVILTPSVTKVGTAHPSTEPPQRDQSGVSTYRFNLSSDEGALLILPEGAERRQLLNDGLFVKKARQNAVEWYNYAVNRRHRIIGQDALYVITGLHKTSSWSVVAFENIAGNESYMAHYKHIPDRSSTTPMYGWETTRASFLWRVGTSIDYVAPSQTVFIRGLKITLRNGFLGPKRISVKADTPSKARSNPMKSLSIVPGNSWVRSSLASRMRKIRNTSRTTTHMEGSTDATEEQVQSNMSGRGGYEGMHAEIERMPNIPPVFHPSNAINQYLLRKDPSANIAITCDSVWMSILEDKLLTTAEFDEHSRLEEVLSQNYDIISHEGIVHLERKSGALVDRQTRSQKITPRINVPNNASDYVSQVSTPINAMDKQDPPVNEVDMGAESDVNTDFQPTTSRISPLNEKPLSPSPRASSEMPSNLAYLPNMTPHSVFLNSTILGMSGDDLSAGSHLERSLSPMPTEYYDSEPPRINLSPPTYDINLFPHASPPAQVTSLKEAEGHVKDWSESSSSPTLYLLNDQNPFAIPISGTSSSRLGDNIEQASTKVRQTWSIPPPVSRSRHVIFFGETGSGKSSIINLIAGREYAMVSSEAMPCTRDFASYEVWMNGGTYRLWDTPGLDQPSMFRRQATPTTESLKQFLKERHRCRELDLLVLCVRDVDSKGMLRVYRMFCHATRQIGIPVVIAITCLETMRPMDAWWDKNGERLRNLGLIFDGHACITSLASHYRWSVSRREIRSLISKDYSRRGSSKLSEQEYLKDTDEGCIIC